MPGQSRLKTLEAQRRILMAESDLNRSHLLEDLARVKLGVNTLKENIYGFIKPLKTLSSLASMATKAGLVISLWRHFRRTKSGPEKNSDHHSSFHPFVSNLFRGMKTGLSLWRTLRR
jgi:hypothetical protein